MDSLTLMPAPATLAWAGIVLAVLAAYQHRQAPAWSQRDIHPIFGWHVIVPVQIIAGLAATMLLTPTWGAPAGIAAATFAWLSVLAISTDLATYKVPRDISYPPAAIGAACFAIDYTLEGAIALGAAFVGVVGIPFLVRAGTNKGLGMSDVRLLIALSATTAWWVGQNWLLYGLIGACVVQMIVRLLAPRFGWGRLVPVTDEPDDERTRRELPFAPALLLAAWAFIAYATTTGYGACQMWNPFGCS